MKGVLRIDFQDLKAGTKFDIIDNMQADSADVYNIPCGMCYLCRLESGESKYIPATYVCTLEPENLGVNWGQRRFELAKAAMVAMIDPKMVTQKYGLLAMNACNLADEMIKHLKME